jgi:hypothetical protein
MSSSQYRDWVVDALRDLGPSAPGRVYDWIRVNRPIPSSDLEGTTSDGKDVLFEKNVRWARLQLFKAGVISSPARGVWALAS